MLLPPGHDSAILGGMTVVGQAGTTGAGMNAGAGATTGAGTNARVAGTTVAAVTGVAPGEAGRLREGAANAAARPTIVTAGGSDGIRIRIGGERDQREQREQRGKGSKLTNPFRLKEFQ